MVEGQGFEPCHHVVGVGSVQAMWNKSGNIESILEEFIGTL